LVDIRYFEVDKIKEILGVHLRMALMDILKVQVSDLDKLINAKKIEVAEAHGNYRGGQQKLQGELVALKAKRHELFMAHGEMRKLDSLERKSQLLVTTRFVIHEMYGKKALKNIKLEAERLIEFHDLNKKDK
jgi:hypothetical protein